MKTHPISLKVAYIENRYPTPNSRSPIKCPRDKHERRMDKCCEMKPLEKWAMQSCLTVLEVVEEDGPLLGLFTPVLDDNARAVDDLASVTLAVKSAYLTQFQLAPPLLFTPWMRSKSPSDIQRPAHSPNFFPSAILINGISCSEQRASMSFL